MKQINKKDPMKIPIILYFLLSVCVFGMLLFYSSRGISYYDEGYILYGGHMIASGAVPYKDFHFAYTPGSIVLTALQKIPLTGSVYISAYTRHTYLYILKP